jgi:DNA-binding MarR family transcriptional regulator
MIRSSSIQAYSNLLVTGQITKQEHKILKYLNKVYLNGIDSVSRKQISDATGLEVNAVSGRVNRLVEVKFIDEEPEKRACPITGSTVIFVSLTRSLKPIRSEKVYA